MPVESLSYIPPSALLTQNKCLACLSEKELLAIIVVSMSQASATYASDIPKLLNDSKCFMALSKKQMLQAFAAIAVNQGLNGLTTTQLRARIKCLECASQKQLSAAFLYITANSFQTAI